MKRWKLHSHAQRERERERERERLLAALLAPRHRTRVFVMYANSRAKYSVILMQISIHLVPPDSPPAQLIHHFDACFSYSQHIERENIFIHQTKSKNNPSGVKLFVLDSSETLSARLSHLEFRLEKNHHKCQKLKKAIC